MNNVMFPVALNKLPVVRNE